MDALPEQRYRDRAGCIAIADSHLLVIRRVHPRYGEYYVFPGGGMHEGEQPVDTIYRELYEETGLHVTVGREVMFGSTPQGKIQHYFLVETPKVPVTLPAQAEENEPERRKERGTYEPMWVPLDTVPTLKLQPNVIKEKVLECVSGSFPDHPVDVGDLYSVRR
ncbi:MAG: NUDIX domain-containing protein [Candidatus Kerfeldbacteria bacterium]